LTRDAWLLKQGPGAEVMKEIKKMAVKKIGPATAPGNGQEVLDLD